jgi:transcriptional regulator with XRE-family HTH domain
VTDDAAGDDTAESTAGQLAAEIKRLRAVAGLSQRDLARRSGYTREYVSMAERQGNIPSRDLIRALDSALEAGGALIELRAQAKADQHSLRQGRQTESEPNKQGVAQHRAYVAADDALRDEARSVSSRPSEVSQLEGLRRSLLGRNPDHDEFGEASLPRLQKGIADAHRMYQQADYDGAAHLLPSLIGQLEGSVVKAPSHVKAFAYLAAAKLATKMGDSGLAWVAADRSLRLARDTDRQGLIGVAKCQLACALLRNGHRVDAEETAAQAAEQLADRARSSSSDIDDIISARGALLLLLAIMAARNGDASMARRYLRAAGLLAEQFGKDGNKLWTAFGRTNVAIHELAVHIALGDSRAGFQLGETIDVDALPAVLRGRRSQVHLELGWASVGQGDDGLAVLHLLEAERVAKQAVSRNVKARALLSTLLARERKGATPGLRALAVRAGAV